MRSTSLITGALAVAATTVPLGIGGVAHAEGPTITTHERGIVVECTGTIRGAAVVASLYENRTHGDEQRRVDEIQVLIGDDADQVGGNRRDRDGFREGRRLRGSMKVDGDRAVVAGTGRRSGEVRRVHDVYDDAGYRITTTGQQHLLDTELTLTWRRHTVPLECATAFRYVLTATKVPIT